VAGWEFVLELDRTGGTPVCQQIARALAAEIQRGRLRPGDGLPGSRTLARTLQVHRQTVVSAIDELIAEAAGASCACSGAGTAAIPTPARLGAKS
jgi:GntR family transcriptional regulator / MocR family aminotransferase